MLAKVFVATVLAAELVACQRPAASLAGSDAAPAVATPAPAGPPAPTPAPAPHVVARTYGVMGTEVTFSLYTVEEPRTVTVTEEAP
jgi:hypothetical protein